MQKSGKDDDVTRPSGSIQNPEAGELWSKYSRRQTGLSGLSKFGLGIVFALALAVVIIGLWIVAFR
ncbi:MAG: hypothetical protein ACO3A4_05620 [Silvanigrellaceae bacterium]